MAFLKGVKKVVEIPVEIDIPVLDENDKYKMLELRPVVLYKRYKRSEGRKIQVEIAKISEEAADAMEEGNIATLLNERLKYFDDLLKASIKGWRNMPGPEDDEVPFSMEVLEEAIEDQHYYSGLMAGLRQALGWGDVPGSEQVEVKN